jgi:hypothetical protein
MKKVYLLFLLLCSFHSNILKAQFYSLGLFAFPPDTTKPMCNLPAKTYVALGELGMCGPICKDSIRITAYFGDGTDTNYAFYYERYPLPSPAILPIHYVWHTYTMAGTFKQKIVATAKSGAKDSVYVTVKVFDSCSTVKGKLFVDDNGNCIADPGEFGLAWIPIRFINTITGDTITWNQWSDSAGNYACNVPFGTYEQTPLFSDFSSPASGDTLTPFCPASGKRTITPSSSSLISDFAYVCARADSFDAFINMMSNGFVPGDTSLISLWSGDWFRNFRNNCFARSTTITLTLDPRLSYASHYDGIAPTGISGSIISWTLTGANLNNFNSRVKIATASTVKLGDTLCSIAHVDTAAGFPDPDLLNNTQNHCRAATSSFDPNMKEVSPAGKGSEGFIAAAVPMTYTIHFQNTGTAPARGITVIDTLPVNLDAASFHLLSSTHNCLLYKDGSVLRFRFNDIYLPDSGANYYGSMGSITYAIRQTPGLTPGMEIKNRAAIYFDYNEPIITNYTLNTIEFPSRIIESHDITARIFPNPARHELNIEMGKAIPFSADLQDMLGRTVSSGKTGNGTLRIPTQSVPSGFYLLHISDDKGNQLNTKIIIQH